MDPSATTSCLVVAGMSVRALAQAARRDGFEVMALDLFGDADTRQASLSWHPIGEADSLRIDPDRFLAALQACAAQGPVRGWVTGSGFEGHAELLALGARAAPLLGCDASVVSAVRDPQRFFAVLDSHGMPHPHVAFRRPDPVDGWLHKNGHACGGWHVRAARSTDADPPRPGQYWQREMPGRPMSMTLLATQPASGGQVLVLGVNEQIVAEVRGRRHAFAGVLGPVKLPDRVVAALKDVAERLVLNFGLVGLCGVDFLLHGEDIGLLEVNPRPPASAWLYAAQGGVIRAHVAACELGLLPGPSDQMKMRPPAISGLQHVYACQDIHLGATKLSRLAQRHDVHDVAVAPVRLSAGEPVCTVSVSGDTAEAVRRDLTLKTEQLLTELETTT